MAKTQGLTKRFGPRYGTTIKLRLEKVEIEQKKKHKCPSCHAFAVRRLSLGIWKCGKCGIKFSGKAYTI